MENPRLPHLGATPDGHWHHHRPDNTEIGWRAELQRVDEQPASTGSPAA